LLNVHKINKQDMQNNVRSIGVKLNVRMIVLSHILTHTYQLRHR